MWNRFHCISGESSIMGRSWYNLLVGFGRDWNKNVKVYNCYCFLVFACGKTLTIFRNQTLSDRILWRCLFFAVVWTIWLKKSFMCSQITPSWENCFGIQQCPSFSWSFASGECLLWVSSADIFSGTGVLFCYGIAFCDFLNVVLLLCFNLLIYSSFSPSMYLDIQLLSNMKKSLFIFTNNNHFSYPRILMCERLFFFSIYNFFDLLALFGGLEFVEYDLFCFGDLLFWKAMLRISKNH
jgi:hypothetical protein